MRDFIYNPPNNTPTLQVLPMSGLKEGSSYNGQFAIVISEPLDYTIIAQESTLSAAQAFIRGLRFAEIARQQILKERAT